MLRLLLHCGSDSSSSKASATKAAKSAANSAVGAEATPSKKDVGSGVNLGLKGSGLAVVGGRDGFCVFGMRDIVWGSYLYIASSDDIETWDLAWSLELRIWIVWMYICLFEDRVHRDCNASHHDMAAWLSICRFSRYSSVITSKMGTKHSISF